MTTMGHLAANLEISGLFAADGEDEAGQAERLKSLRRELVDPKMNDCHG